MLLELKGLHRFLVDIRLSCKAAGASTGRGALTDWAVQLAPTRCQIFPVVAGRPLRRRQSGISFGENSPGMWQRSRRHPGTMRAEAFPVRDALPRRGLRVTACLCFALRVVVGDSAVAEEIHSFVDERGVPHFSNVPADPRYRLFLQAKAAAGSDPTAAASAAGIALVGAAVQDPDPQVRLRALEQGVQTTQGTASDAQSIDRITHALVDPDEQVRARAQELFEQELGRR